ncbi:hypothetical protein [Williamsia sp. D3]|uniref:hypothetical protein n=1 Tax=Williamsia TaxID=85043 RepID=UPI0003D31DA1|nr:hypothetical protein [Williamsia sp. D3]ETD34320.1 hypothetical protein W823_02880 [Williamsia sp. D3]
MALSRAEEWAKAKEFVAEHADELHDLDSPSALFKYCEKKRHGGKSLWPKVRTELRKQLGIDLDQMRADAAAALADKARHLSDSSADAPTVELYTAGELLEKPSRDDPDEVEIVPAFAIADLAGDPVWFGNVHPNDRDKMTDELAVATDAARKAVWLAGQVRDDQGLEMVRVIIHHSHPGLDAAALARAGVKHLVAVTLSHVDDSAENPATAICLDAPGYRDWHEHRLSDLLATPAASGR